jgi:hypothetical protein
MQLNCFKYYKIKIVFIAENTLEEHLCLQKPFSSNGYDGGAIYKLKCLDCNRS